jgi:hypothetical protein
MNAPDQGNVYFYGSQLDIAASQPYAILSTRYVTFMVNRLDAWARMMAVHPELSAMCGEEKSLQIEIATAWRDAIDRSIQDGHFPNVILPVKHYEEAMLLLKVTCQMEADLHEMIEQECQYTEDIAVHSFPLLAEMA